MTLVGDPLIGVVYRTHDTNETYTHWYHESKRFPFNDPSAWLSDRLQFDTHLRNMKIRSDRIVMIVRAK